MNPLWPLSWLGLAVAAAALLRGQRLRHQRQTALARQEHERALREQQDQFQLQFHSRQKALFDSMTEGVLWLDRNGRVRMINESLRKFFDVTADVRGQTIMEAFRWHELAALAARLQKEKSIFDAELEIQRVRRRSWQVNAALVPAQPGGEEGQLFVFHEVTRLKELENIRTEFVGNVSHELRTPLSLIKGSAETLLDGAIRDPQQAMRFLQKIDKHSDRLLFLIEDLLVISRLESGQTSLNLAQVDLRELAQRVLEDLAARAAARQVALENKIPPQTIVWADADRLQQVFFNLADNAIKYGRTGGCVSAGARDTGDKTEVFVADDGPGIPPESLGRVFERFYRVDRARSRENGGTGLGLAIVKHIVQAHGGEAWVKSEMQKGATFHFTLPKKPAPASTAAA
ncbi:MAG TPA: ATP-binding protein [Verrucomicrobiae bacterium]|jgi:two-component system phosphate regulon sensor histidine kinase PhoR